MRQDQTIEIIRTGLINTLFRDRENIKEHFAMFFGDGEINVTNFNSLLGSYCMKLEITSFPYIKNQYKRVFIIGYRDSSRGDMPYKITSIEEWE